jgi:hypothetical protein
VVDSTDLAQEKAKDKVELGRNMRAIAIPKRVLPWPEGEPGPRAEVCMLHPSSPRITNMRLVAVPKRSLPWPEGVQRCDCNLRIDLDLIHRDYVVDEVYVLW